MIIFPAIDIRDGNYVRLEEGDFNRETVFGDNPPAMARYLEEQGAQYLHVIDLDGAKGEGKDNSSVISEIAQNIKIPVQTGGGIRDFEKIRKMLDGGAARVILGTAAVQDPSFLKQACKMFPDSIAVSIDVKDRFVATHGWQNVSKIKDTDYLAEIENFGVSAVVYTDISRDGMLQGTNIESIISVNEKTSLPLIASGGVTTAEEIRTLQTQGIYGAIIGKALYTGALSMADLKEFL
ncbi:1-(5-phosphoribosyl)-5-[(5-phosphoribosylamino)methylideneamino]imidazole-4-carboxamide isomerase [Planctomycetota bacterium]